MEDHELLKLAAKAAGYEIYAEADDGPAIDYIRLDRNYSWMPMSEWNPLTEDGDALRLAVKLRLEIVFDDAQVRVYHRAKFFAEDYGSDLCAATRRAIVRAAAEIGKSM